MTAFELFGVLKLDKKDFDSGLKEAKRETDSFGSALGGVGGAIGSGLKTAMGVAVKAVGAATVAVTGFTTTAVQAGSAFDQAMGGVAATMGQTVDELSSNVGEVDTSFGHFSGTLREFAIYMGKNTTFSATQAAEALNYMALAGYKTQESMEMLPSVLNMAAAGGMELAKASDMITDTQAALGLDFKRTNLMVDEFAKAASTGNTSVEQLGEAMLRVGGLARETNGGFITLADGSQAVVDNVQEMEIAFTAMANAGIKGAEAGTHMRNMLLKLSDPTDKGTAALEAMGVAIYDDEGKMRSLNSIFTDLNESFKTMTQQEKLQTIGNLFNTRDTASAEALLAAVEGTVVKIGDEIYSMDTAYEKFGDDIYDSTKGFEIVQSSWDEIGESILNASGAADQMSKTKLDNLTGDITLFKSALESTQIALNDKLSPSMREFVQLGTKGITALGDIFGNFDASEYVNQVGLAAEDAEAELQAHRQAAMRELLGVVSDGINIIASKIPTVIDMGMKLLEALGKGILDNLPTLVDSAVQIVVKLSEGMVKALPALANGVVTLVKSLKESFSNNKDTLMQVGKDLLSMFMDGMVNDLPRIAQGAVVLIGNLAQGFGQAIPQIISGALDIVFALVEALTSPEALGSLLQGAVSLIMGLAQGIVEALPRFIEEAPKIIQNFVDALVENLPIVLEAGMQLIVMLVQAIIENLPLIIASAIQIITTLISGLVEMLPSLMLTGIQMVVSLVAGLMQSYPKLWDGGIKIVKALIEGIYKMFGSIIKASIELVTKFIQTIVDSKQKIGKAGVDMVKALYDGLKQKIEDAKTWGRDLMDNFIGGIEEKLGALKDTVTGIGQAIKDRIGFSEPKVGPLSNFHTYAPDMMKLFTEGIKDNTYLVTDQIAKSFDFSDAIQAPTVNASSVSQILALLKEIAEFNKNVTVVLEGDADRIFRVVQRESRRNEQITGQPSFA